MSVFEAGLSGSLLLESVSNDVEKLVLAILHRRRDRRGGHAAMAGAGALMRWRHLLPMIAAMTLLLAVVAYAGLS
jgi:hypothetical protein